MTNHSQLVEAAKDLHLYAIGRSVIPVDAPPLVSLRYELAALEASPEGERGDGKGQDYGPSASASDVETIKASARVAVCPTCGGTGTAGDHPTGGYSEACRVCSGTGELDPPAAQPDGIDLPTAPKIDCERCGRSFSALDLAAHIPDCQPVPPSGGEVAAGPWEVRTMGLIWRRDDELGITCGTIDVTDPRTLIDPETLCELLNEYEARPEGHVAVYLPVEDVAGIAHTGFKEDCPDSEDLERFGTLYKACRQALSNGEGA